MSNLRTLNAARKATIVDVAREAGVSVATVSLALNGSDRCSAVTAERVRTVAQELSYVPNHLASSLRRQSTQTVALVVPDIGNPVYVAMAKAVQRVVKARGYHLSLVSTDEAAQEEVHAIEGLAQRHVDGLIMCSLRVSPELITALEAAQAPVCMIGRVSDAAGVDNVGVDSEQGAALAVAHLAEQGRHVIGFINGEADTVPGSTRLRGFERALQEHRLERDGALIVYSAFTMEGGYAAVDRLLAHRPDMDAIFCANDVIAIGALKRLRERGISVPRQMAVIGMDDITECLICTPTLSSVALHAGERGRLAAELLLDRLASPEPRPVQRVMVTPQLIVRESSGFMPARTRTRKGRP